MRICEQLQTSDQSVKEEVQDETIKAADVKQRLLESSQAKVTEHHQAGEVVEGGEAEKAPIPPPRRKRKKKLQRSPSLEKIEVRTVRIETILKIFVKEYSHPVPQNILASSIYMIMYLSTCNCVLYVRLCRCIHHLPPINIMLLTM